MNKLVVGNRIYNLDHVRKVYIGGDYIMLYYISGHEDKITKLDAVSPLSISKEDIDTNIHFVWTNPRMDESFIYNKKDIDKEWDRNIKELKGTPS